MVNLFAFVRKQKASKQESSPPWAHVTVWIRKSVLLLGCLSRQPVVSLFPAAESYAAFSCCVSCRLVFIGFSVLSHFHSVDISKELRFLFSPQPESVQCFLIPSPGLGFWQIYHLIYTVLSTSRQEARDVTVSRQCSAWSLSHQRPLGDSGILWGDKPRLTTILFLIKPPKHQRPLGPHSLTITGGPKWWFFFFFFQLHYSFLIHQQASCCKEEVSFSLIYLSLLCHYLFWYSNRPQFGQWEPLSVGSLAFGQDPSFWILDFFFLCFLIN